MGQPEQVTDENDNGATMRVSCGEMGSHRTGEHHWFTTITVVTPITHDFIAIWKAGEVANETQCRNKSHYLASNINSVIIKGAPYPWPTSRIGPNPTTFMPELCVDDPDHYREWLRTNNRQD